MDVTKAVSDNSWMRILSFWNFQTGLIMDTKRFLCYLIIVKWSC